MAGRIRIETEPPLPHDQVSPRGCHCDAPREGRHELTVPRVGDALSRLHIEPLGECDSESFVNVKHDDDRYWKRGRQLA
jgi:hypothetical protein